MRLNKYNSFLLESAFMDLLLESKLEILANLRQVLYELAFSDDNSVRKVADKLLDIANSDKDLRLVQNFINIDSDATKVSFIPDNRVKYGEESDVVAINLDQYEKLNNIVAKGHEIISDVGIPLEGLKQTTNPDELPSNRWRVLGSYEGRKAAEHYSEYTLYHLQNVDDPSVYIVSFDSGRHGKGFRSIPNTPENLRGSVKIGRFINKIFDLYFADDKEQRANYSASDVEKFVNAYSALILYRRNAYNFFEIVTGEKIKHWYLKDNYAAQTGQLGSSCMRHASCQDYFNLYIENPEVCQLLIFKSTTGDKINGRALLWTDVDGKKWIDRVYTIKDSYMSLFSKWAAENGYTDIYRSGNDAKVKVKNKDYGYYPYVDSLNRLKFSCDIDDLTDEDLDKEAFLTTYEPDRPYIVLGQTDGEYSRRS